MKKLIFAIAVAVVVQASGLSQPVKPPTLLPHAVVNNGARLQVPVAETVSEVVLESKAKGAKTWTARPTTVKNLPGNRRLIIDVPLALRGQDLRVTLRATRPAPQTVAFTPDKTKARMQVPAGLPAATKLSAEYFDKAAQQWKRFATVQAPRDIKKPWTVSVPSARRAAELRLARIDAKAASSQSAKFPAAFRTGKTKFAGREITDAGRGSELANSPGQLTANSSAKSASPQIEESDIWKISGTKIYFFNQLRGLQVIETANAADPEIVSFLRMPAVGEDMYVLPGSRAVLVRRDWRNGGTTGVVLVDASLPQAKVMAELQVPGWYADSRLVNGRLVLATTQWDSASWQSSTTVRVIDNLAAAPRIAAEAMLDFSANAMGAGSEFLWVSGSKNWSWTQSSIALFPLDALPALGTPLRAELGGMIYDKFKVHQNGATLFAVTQSWGANWRQSTALESYSLGAKPTLLQRLPLVEGESLHATRFHGDRAYVVTFEQIDPLWIIDLADPSAMRIESELQVPGWSTYIQPVGGYLAAVGVDAGKVTASLFDVRHPAKPSLSSRVDIGGDGNGYTWSEANWDEKAVAILPESGLILLPFSSFNSEGDLSAVQLVDMDAKNGKLTKRGVIRHAFTPRRANALRAGIVASISNRELFLLDAANRDKPAALAEVTLAFAADRILGSRDGLLVHAENGDWRGSAAMLRVSAATDPDAVAAEASLGDGEILAGALRGNHLVALLRSHKNPEEGRIVRFDAAQLPKLVETGRSTFKLTAAWNASSELVWPSDNLAVAAVRSSNWGWWRGPWMQDAPMVSATAKMSISPGIYPPPYSFGEESVTLYAFDLSAALPRPASTFDLAAISPRNASNFFAADGLVVFSSERAQEEKLPAGKTVPTPRLIGQTFLQVADYADPAAPSLWPEAALPGRLENITEFDRAAGLVFAANNDGGLEALLYEGGSAQSIAALPKSDLRSSDARTVWALTGKSLSRHRLADSGAWTPEGTRADLPFADPAALRAHAGGLLMRRGDEVASVPSDFSAPIKRLTILGWNWWGSSDLSQAAIGTQSVAIPAGQYGIEVLR
jgi:uncharacterized secreted protein with C-terminal beta-propeller domain